MESNTFVFKIKLGNSIRRLTVPRSAIDVFSFGALESKIRDLLQIHVTTPIVIKYMDRDQDVVTMADDQDLKDACIVQSLNPLSLTVTTGDSSSNAASVETSQLTVPKTGVAEKADSMTNSANNEPAHASTFRQFIEHIFPEHAEAILRNILKSTLPEQTGAAFEKIVQAVLNAASIEDLIAIYERDIRPKYGASAAAISTLIGSLQIHLLPELAATFNFSDLNSISVPVASQPSGDGSESSQWDSPPSSSGNSQKGVPTLHRGVQCDSCGQCPIVGPRFKSKKKENFDLCSNCHKKADAADDYVKMEQPELFSHPCDPLLRKYKMMQSGMRGFNQSGGPFLKRDHQMRGQKPGCWGNDAPYSHCNFKERLNARFVNHVTIFDGTELAPGTHFTKIWRLRNSGTLPWPSHVRLVQVSGDELGCTVSELLELSEHGLPPGEEIEVSVDLIVPQKPGRYASRWRLQLPFGPKFGHDVSLLIQVVSEAYQTVHAEGDEEALISPNAQTQTAPYSELANIHGDESANKSSLGIEASSSDKEPFENSNSESRKLPVADFVPCAPKSVVVTGNGPTETPDSDKSQEPGNMDATALNAAPVLKEGEGVQRKTDALLAKLQLIGFTDQTLNLELLEKNQFDLRLTIEDLVAAADWEPMLQQLQEMGFDDRKLNLILMFKNQGSVKGVVKELLQREKVQSRQVGKAGLEIELRE